MPFQIHFSLLASPCTAQHCTAVYTLTVGGMQAHGTYKLAGNASGFNKTITVKDTAGGSLGSLTVGQTSSIGGVGYQLNESSGVLSVTVGAAAPASAAKGDRDGNGVSDVMFVWTGEHGEGNHAHGY